MPSAFRGLLATLIAQDECGWKAFLEGTPVVGWAGVQQAFYDWKGSRRLGARWLAALIQKLWDVAWDQWQHRNHVLHDVNEGALALQRQSEIKEQFQLGRGSLSGEAWRLFLPGVAAVLKYNVALQEAWLNRVKSTRAREERKGDELTFRQERQGMASWLASSVRGGLV